MAFGDLVQSGTGTGSSGEASATLPGAATAGNLLIACVARAATHSEGGSWGEPAGWTRVQDTGVNNGNLGGAMWWKIAAGGETSFTPGGSGEQANWTASLAEYESPYEESPADVTAEDESNLATTVTSQSSGTTAATAQADELAIAFFMVDNGGSFGTRQYTNSFTEALSNISGARAAHVQVKRVLSATGTVETTLSYSSGGAADEMYGAVATFKKQAAGGGGTTAPRLHRMGLLGVQ